MAKYLILYNTPEGAQDVMANASEEEVKASMAEWMTWKDEAEKKVKIDFGMPMQAVKRLTASDVGTSSNQASGHATLEGSEDDVVDVLKSHPHLKRPGASIDMFEILPLPGM